MPFFGAKAAPPVARTFWRNEHAAPDQLSADQFLFVGKFYACYAFLRYALLPFYCQRLSPTYRRLPDYEKTQWITRLVSLIHVVPCLALAGPRRACLLGGRRVEPNRRSSEQKRFLDGRRRAASPTHNRAQGARCGTWTASSARPRSCTTTPWRTNSHWPTREGISSTT